MSSIPSIQVKDGFHSTMPRRSRSAGSFPATGLTQMQAAIQALRQLQAHATVEDFKLNATRLEGTGSVAGGKPSALGMGSKAAVEQLPVVPPLAGMDREAVAEEAADAAHGGAEEEVVMATTEVAPHLEATVAAGVQGGAGGRNTDARAVAGGMCTAALQNNGREVAAVDPRDHVPTGELLALATTALEASDAAMASPSIQHLMAKFSSLRGLIQERSGQGGCSDAGASASKQLRE